MLLTTPLSAREGRMERETGIEPATSSLGSSRSTAELLPRFGNLPNSTLLVSGVGERAFFPLPRTARFPDNPADTRRETPLRS